MSHIDWKVILRAIHEVGKCERPECLNPRQLAVSMEFTIESATVSYGVHWRFCVGHAVSFVDQIIPRAESIAAAVNSTGDTPGMRGAPAPATG